MSERDADEDPVYLLLEAELREHYPDWRVTTHYTPADQKVVMVEFANRDDEYAAGLPGEFVSLVSGAGGEMEGDDE